MRIHMNKLLERSDGEKCRPHMTIPAGTTNSLNINCVINNENDIYHLFTPHTFLMQNKPNK